MVKKRGTDGSWQTIVGGRRVDISADHIRGFRQHKKGGATASDEQDLRAVLDGTASGRRSPGQQRAGLN